MPATARRPVAAVRRIALAACVAAFLAIAPLGASAQAPGGGWTLVATWLSRRPTTLYDTLDWPPGHEAGGVGAARHAERMAATDLTADTVRVYAQDGRYLTTWGGPGSALGRFDEPRDVAPLPDGGWVVSDTGNDRVQRLAADGTAVSSWPVAEPRGIAVAVRGQGFPDEDAAVFVVAAGDGRVRAFGPDGTERDGPTLAAAAGTLDALEIGDIGGAPGGPLAADLSVVERDAGPILAGESRRLGDAWHVPATGAPFVRVRWPGLAAALSLRAPSTSPAPPSDDAAVLLGADGLGIFAVASSGATGGPAAVLPFDAVGDLGRTRGGSLVATVAPEGLVWLGDSAETLFTRLRGDTSGRMFGPRFIAAGVDVMLGDALPRTSLWTIDGAPIAVLPAPTGPLLPVPLPVADLAQDGDLRVVLRADGALHLIENGRYTRFYEPRASSGRHLVAVAAYGQRVAALDLMRQEVVLLDGRLQEIESWALSDDSDDFVGALDIALSEANVALARPGDGLLDIRNLVGTPFRTVVVPGGIERVTAAVGGGFLALTPGGRAVRIDADGLVADAFPVGVPGDQPSDIAVGVYGQLFVADARGAVRVYAPDDDEAMATVPARPSPGTCAIGVDKRAVPRRILLGEAVTVQLTLDGACAEAPAQLDIALVVDRSQSMAAEGRLAAAIEAALGFTARANPLAVRLALVAFADAAAVIRPLTSDRADVATRLIGLSPGGASTDLVGALRAGVQAVSGPDARPPGEARRVVVLLTDGHHTATTPPLEELATALAEASAASVDTYTIGLGGSPDRETLRRMAGDPARAYASPSTRDLAAIYTRIAHVLTADRLLEWALLVDTLPANMRLVPGSGTPVEPEVAPDGRTLRWRLEDVAEPGVTVAFRVVPQTAGLWPTNAEATGDLRDGLGITARVRFPVPLVEVTDPRVPSPTATVARTPTDEPTPTPRASATATASRTPSPTPTGALRTATPTATGQRTPSPTRPPSPTATAGSERLFLPLGMVPRVRN